MPYSFFHQRFPQIAVRETRSLMVVPDSDVVLLPAGEYGFFEMYCDEPGCDCRRVLLYVEAPHLGGVQAVVAWGWEDLAFYRKWFKHGDAEAIRHLKGPVLNLGSPETELAPAILELTRDVLLKDADYVDRIKRHYQMFRRDVEGPDKPAIRVRRKPPKLRRKASR